jgi:hypothetical protein
LRALEAENLQSSSRERSIRLIAAQSKTADKDDLMDECAIDSVLHEFCVLAVTAAAPRDCV